MSSGLKIDNVYIQVRDILQKDGIKLWQDPYYTTTGPSYDELEVLAVDYSQRLHLPYDSCYAAISELQSHALEKLKERDIFKESGLATLKIKFLIPNGSPKLITKQILLSACGTDLKQVVSENAEIPSQRIKLIACGKVINDSDTLRNQGIQNGQQILAIFLNESITDIRDAEERLQDLESTKADAQLLASDGSHYMELEDQAGNTVKMPEQERKSLMIAMTLHEKGKSALKKEDYAKALVFFLDADNEFGRCNSKVLSLVDNYALLDLDIAWCYLCLQSVNHLPEAYDRLKRCETAFEKSYGPNLERVIAVKGTAGNEAVLFLRLHLLQGIVLFHQNKREEALHLLMKVKTKIQELKVDDDSILSLTELGYSVAEARLGLRATNGNINLAANYINENREKRSDLRRKALAERIVQKKQRKLGKCADGKQFVNPSFVQMLVNMGYNKEAARSALRMCNNIISDSIQYIQENPGPSGTRSQEVISLINDLIPELQAAGFDYNNAKMALEKYSGDIMKAAEELLVNGGIIQTDNALDNYAEDNKNTNDEKLKEEALIRLSQDISMVDDDHLDISLQQEEQFLNQYLSLLQRD